ncbi:amidohydrolase family protein [Brachybacterium huguangmaarense]|uniref:Amidohydrolase family protein n=1 Tax=Brachybacterium huguangmaarense TaxID=1652028 RepID=A0ABY6G0C6_9MICO|nr:amidohydrolase family protein [Brachybacterium huguangmaarense]UYG16649.1 amidohydrolase family protein [Brachybacterium huguangmaarense]
MPPRPSEPREGAPEPAGQGVTDAHLHLWDLGASPYAWLDAHPALHRSFGWEDARRGHEALGVRRVVLVQADDTLADTQHLQRTATRIEAAGGQVSRADVVAWLSLADPERVGALLADPAAMVHVVGVRHLVHDDPDPGFLERPDVARSLDLLAGVALPLDVPDAYPRHLEQVVRVAQAHPDLTLVLDHLGKPPLGDAPGMARWEEQLRRIAAQPSTVAKVSGLATSGDGRFEEAVAIALEVFGPERLMFGSDWPIAPAPADHACGAGRLLGVLRGWEPAAREMVLNGTADRVDRRLPVR